MSSDGGAKRWWDDYLVRYLMPTIAGVAIVIWLGDIADAGDANKRFQELLFLPKTISELKTPTLILLFLYGNLFCYVASFPILSFHATRVLDFKNSTWPHSHLWDGYIVTPVFIVFVVLLIYLSPTNWLRYWLAFPLTFAFSVYQVARILMVLKSTKDWKSNKAISLVYAYASTLAKRRSLPEETTSETPTNDKPKKRIQDLRDTYSHQREHGNSGFIFLLELTLAGLTYCILVNKELSAPQILSAVGILFAFWAFPAALVHMLAQHLERSLAEDDR